MSASDDIKCAETLRAELAKPYNDYLCDGAVLGNLLEAEVDDFLDAFGMTLASRRDRRIFSRALDEALAAVD